MQLCRKMPRLCNCFPLAVMLLLFVQLCTCVYISVQKTVSFYVRGSQHMMLFPTIDMDGDGPRDLSSACNFCHMHVSNKRWDIKKSRQSATIRIYWFFSGEPWLYGHLKICWGDKNVFRQFPITLRSKYSLKCEDLTRKFMAPKESAMEPLSLGIYTWFMSRKNYDDLRLRGSTDLLVPLLPDESYELPVHIMLFHEASREDGVKCTLERPYVVSPAPLIITKQSDNVRHYTKHLTKIRFKVKSLPKKSGTYTVKCHGKYYYQPEDTWFPLHIEKDITLRFEKVPRIELAGIAGNTVFIPYSNETGKFYVNIYSTSDIVNLHISRSDGIRNKATFEILTKFISHPYYQLLAKYRVTLPWLDNSITGLYTITARNKQEQSAKLEIRLHRVDELVVLVNPVKMEAEEASSVTFHCLVLTDLPANTTVKWDLGPLSKEGSIESKELSVGGAVALTFHSVTLSQSGSYTCVADNGLQRVEKTVTLVAFPPGTLNYRAEHKATWMERMSCDKVLDVDTVNSMKTAAKVVVVVVVVILVVVASAVSALVGWKIYQWIQQKKQSMSESDNTDNGPEESQPLLGSSMKEGEGQEKGESEVESELAELLQSMEASQAHTPSPQGKGKMKKPAMKSKKRDTAVTDTQIDDIAKGDEEVSHKTTVKKKRPNTTDGKSEKDELVQDKKKEKPAETGSKGKKSSNTAETGDKDEKRKTPSDGAETGSKRKKPSETAETGDKDEKRKKPSKTAETGSKDETKAKEATQKSTDIETRKGKGSSARNKREK